ncbi:MAG TPA: hypothetical protein VKV26_11165 [Dehalococcoidia bacterium]|nr:hypothetical protein [Dehalococcoidia bacterium]
MAAMLAQDRPALEARLELLAADATERLNILKVQGKEGEFRLRSGGWRAGFTRDPRTRTVTVIWVEQRKDAY